MPIETLDDIIEELADKFGIYGTGPEGGDHPEDCKCRICFCAWLKGRIEKAAEVESRLRESSEFKHGPERIRDQQVRRILGGGPLTN